MASAQRPLGSGFGPASTVDDVLEGVDLAGTRAVVTGGAAGLGLVTTRALRGAGASVVVGARDTGRAVSALHDAGVDDVDVVRLDLLDPSSVTAFAAEVAGAGPLHLLVDNAGIPAPSQRREDARGYELQFATNHLGHFQLTNALLPALRAAHGARVVVVTSGGHRLSDIRWADPHWHNGYDPALAYGQSKTANVLFAVEADRRWADEGIRVYAAHPGIVVGTALNSGSGEDALRAMGLIDAAGEPVIDPSRDKKTPQQGAATILFAATSPLLEGVGGVYLRNSDVSDVDEHPVPLHFGTAQMEDVDTRVVAHAIDPGSARRLWTLSEDLLRLPA